MADETPVRKVEEMTVEERVTTARALITDILKTYGVELATSLAISTPKTPKETE